MLNTFISRFVCCTHCSDCLSKSRVIPCLFCLAVIVAVGCATILAVILRVTSAPLVGALVVFLCSTYSRIVMSFFSDRARNTALYCGIHKTARHLASSLLRYFTEKKRPSLWLLQTLKLDTLLESFGRMLVNCRGISRYVSSSRVEHL